jgi:hypothetical protein
MKKINQINLLCLTKKIKKKEKNMRFYDVEFMAKSTFYQSKFMSMKTPNKPISKLF